MINASDNIKLTPAFEDALETLEHTQQNVFITGKAGTGKSTFLDYFRKQTKKNVVVVAPTGVSALNVRGQTIHSFFGLDPRIIDISKIGRRRNRKVYKEIELLIIDEISMVRADVLDGLEKVLRVNGPVEGAPFGGVQICVIGDLFQLPPVVTNDEKEIFNKFYQSPFFFDAPSFDMNTFKLIRFNDVFRQADSEFINILNRVRVGQKTPAILDFLNQRHMSPEEADESFVTLCTTNKLADTINDEMLDELTDKPYTFRGKKTGEIDKYATRLPAPEKLQLKEGAQVMFVKNDPDKRWVNGTIGIVKELNLKSIEVEVYKNDKWVTYNVTAEKWPSIHYTFDEEKEELKEEEVGSYTQFPLTLAWAITIHKSQGKTLDNVIIDLGYGAFAPGQLYVALSRCKTFEKIYLKKRISPRDIQCDKRILDFVKEYQASQNQQQSKAS